MLKLGDVITIGRSRYTVVGLSNGTMINRPGQKNWDYILVDSFGQELELTKEELNDLIRKSKDRS